MLVRPVKLQLAQNGIVAWGHQRNETIVRTTMKSLSYGKDARSLLPRLQESNYVIRIREAVRGRGCCRCPGPSQSSEQRKEVRFQQTDNQGLRQFFLTAQHTSPDGVLVSL